MECPTTHYEDIDLRGCTNTPFCPIKELWVRGEQRQLSTVRGGIRFERKICQNELKNERKPEKNIGK